MAKRRKKVLPARKPEGARDEDDSLLTRSAESLGRVIGSLQRQVQRASGKVREGTKKKARKTSASRRKSRSRSR